MAINSRANPFGRANRGFIVRVHVDCVSVFYSKIRQCEILFLDFSLFSTLQRFYLVIKCFFKIWRPRKDFNFYFNASLAFASFFWATRPNFLGK